MKPEHQIPLAASVAWNTALVVAIAMLAYAVGQYLWLPDAPFWRLLVGHSWHVLAISLLTYATLHTLLHHQVVKPVQQLYVKLYGISQGDDTPITVNTRVREIQDIAESVNLMMSQFRRASHEPWVTMLRVRGKSLKELSERESITLDGPDRETLAHTSAELRELAGLLERFEARVQKLSHPL